MAEMPDTLLLDLVPAVHIFRERLHSKLTDVSVSSVRVRAQNR